MVTRSLNVEMELWLSQPPKPLGPHSMNDEAAEEREAQLESLHSACRYDLITIDPCYCFFMANDSFLLSGCLY